MNRRDFTKLSALSLAAARLPAMAQSAMASMQPVGFAPVGLGTISNIFMQACVGSQSAKITGLVTGHPDEKGRPTAAKYGVDAKAIYTYETFDRIRDNKAIDAVYIGLPNSMHCEYTVRAAEAGKHVLCEKPMAINSAECRRMIDACRAAKVKLMIAYRCHYNPVYHQVKKLIDSGAIGELQGFTGAFGSQKTDWRVDKKLAGGGPIFDLGIYPLNAMRYFSGEDAVAYTAQTVVKDKQDPRFKEMEESMVWTMRFPSGIVGTGSTSYNAEQPGFLQIQGSKGALDLYPAYDYSGIHFEGMQGLKNLSASAPEGNTHDFTHEAEHFAMCVRNNVEPATPGEEGLKDMLAIEAIYQAAGPAV